MCGQMTRLSTKVVLAGTLVAAELANMGGGGLCPIISRYFQADGQSQLEAFPGSHR